MSPERPCEICGLGLSLAAGGLTLPALLFSLVALQFGFLLLLVASLPPLLPWLRNARSCATGSFISTPVELTDGKVVALDVWDTSGQGEGLSVECKFGVASIAEGQWPSQSPPHPPVRTRCNRFNLAEVYKSLAKIYCRAANIGVIVFSLIDHGSFESAREWVASLRATAPEGIVIGIAGNKLDLANAADRQVSREDALAFAAEIGASYLETSALSGEGVAELFISLANLVPRSTMAPRRTMVKLDGPAGGSSSSGCSC